jgi:hypothetical protein
MSEPGPDEADQNARGRILYLRSYFVMRALIGLIGVGLPVLLLVGDWLFLQGTPRARGSLSAYYYSGMHDAFVGILFATAIFLVTYKVVERRLDNALSILAGIAVMGVALFPTGRPRGEGSLTPLQQSLGESTVAIVHFTCAGVFIVLLAIISYCFGVDEGGRTQRRGHGRTMLPPTFWRRFHKLSALVIVLSVVFMAVTKWRGWFDDYSLLVGESVAVLAFGVSWLMKGMELDVLFGRNPPVDADGPRPLA